MLYETTITKIPLGDNGVWDDENNCMMFDLAKTQPNDRRDNL